MNDLKHWINDHNAGASTGGLAVFYCYAGTNMNTDPLPPESQHTGEGIVTQFGSSLGHAMTIVRYNDNIMYDFNQDGQFTNDVDINNDGEVNIQDREIIVN